ncbi:hypothetical protein HA402_007415 [Bradysia odoriphaga]|nr:hypothetical protein HA402_007415 [Bradysia odoriphaga]
MQPLQRKSISSTFDRRPNHTCRLYRQFVRVRPLMNSVRARCLELPVEECLSIDEQMIPMRGGVTKGVKQYVKNKPNIKWGIKNLVLCGKSGLAYDFACYQGSTTEFDPEMREAFGSGATMVLHLANRIQRSGHKLFFDNYFSSFQLFEILAQKKSTPRRGYNQTRSIRKATVFVRL